jgi:hypothetical protein
MWVGAQRLAAKSGITDITIAPTKDSASLSKTDGLSGVKKAMPFEEECQYNEAITPYLSRTAADCGGEDRLDQVLERVVKLFAIFFSGRLRDVVTNVAQILIGMNRHASLAKSLENIEEYADAFEIYKLAEIWGDANRLSTSLDQEDEAAFQREYKQHLASHSDTKGLMSLGQVYAALRVYVIKGDLETCLRQV